MVTREGLRERCGCAIGWTGLRRIRDINVWLGGTLTATGQAERGRNRISSGTPPVDARGSRIESSNGQTVYLALLRGFALTFDDQAIDLPASAQRLLAFLALCDRPVTRRKVAGVLWAEMSDERSAANLRSSLWRLKRPGLTLVESGRCDLRLSPSVRVDVKDLVTGAHDLLDGTEHRSLDFDEVCLAGDLLPDWYDDWVLVERERLRQLRLHALEALADDRVRAGRFAEAADVALAAIAAEPLRESAQRALINVHIAEGNFGEAVRQYRLYSELLFEEMGVGPSPHLESMMQRFDRRMTER